MRIVDVQERAVPISSTMSNAYISFAAMNLSAVALVSDVVRDGKPVVGYGFNSNGRYAQSGLLRERFIPRLLAASPEMLCDGERTNFDAEKIWDVLMTDEKPGGHGERSVAVGVIDMAVWDLIAKVAEQPLHRLLAERVGRRPLERVFVYAAGGYYEPGRSLASLAAEMRGHLDLGYSTVKLKIGAAPLADDLERIATVVDAVGDPGKVMVDANGRMDLSTALTYAEALEPLGLFWFEEAGDPLDYRLQAVLAEHYSGPLATGENLFSHQDARNLLRYGGMRPDRDWLQFDPALSYGLTEFMRTLAVLDAHGWSPGRVIPHGGHQFALAMAAGLGLGGNESYPTLFRPFSRFADGNPIRDGWVSPSELPGIGIEGNGELFAVFRDLFRLDERKQR